MTAFLYTVSDGVLESEPSLVDIDVLPTVVFDEPDTEFQVDGDLSDWSEYDSVISDTAGDVPGSNNPIDFISAAARYDEFAVYFAYENKNTPLSEIDEWSFNIYLDTDADPASGLTDGMSIGSEYLLQGASLYQYNGDGTSWDWQYLGDGIRAITGTTAEVSLYLSSIGNPALIDYVLVGDNISLGGDRQDFYPDDIYNPKSGNRFFSLFVDDDLSDPFANTDDPFTDDLSFDAAKEEPVSGERGIFAEQFNHPYKPNKALPVLLQLVVVDRVFYGYWVCRGWLYLDNAGKKY